MGSSVVYHMQGIQQHACHCAYAWDPTNSAHSPKRRQEARPTGAEHVLRQLDVHDHQHTLKASMDTMHQCVAGSATPKKTVHMLADELDDGAKPMHRLQWRQEFTSARCHHGVHAHHHGWPSLASVHYLHHHKHVKELVSPQRTKCQWCLAWFSQAILSHMGTRAL